MSEQQIQKVKVKRLAHVGLWASDILAQARFYRQVLGFEVRPPLSPGGNEETDWEDASIFLALGDEYHCLGLFSDTRPALGNGRLPSQRSRLHHLSFEVDSDAELAALAARLNQAGIELTLAERDGNPDAGDTLWFYDPDGNHVEISAAADDFLLPPTPNSNNARGQMRPHGLQHVALRTPRLDAMVDFYTEALGFDTSDWLLRECAWLRCNHDHHTLLLIEGEADVEHMGYRIFDGQELLQWADYLSRCQTPLLWGPGRHGAGSDLFLRFADAEGIHIELSAELQQYYDRDVTTPPRLWHTRTLAYNLWGTLPAWTPGGVGAQFIAPS